MAEYKKRIVDHKLKEKLEARKAVVVVGPKWCGKTTTSERCAKSILYLDDPEKKELNIIDAETFPKKLLEGEKPRLIDEWQLAPKLWDAIRFYSDHNDGYGFFILTGSSTPIKKDEITHSGTGRFSFLKMRTMSLFESGESDGSVSLSSLFDNPPYLDGKAEIDSHILSFLIERGGWPDSLNKNEKASLEDAKDYFDLLVKEDINRSNKKPLNTKKAYAFMRSLARHMSSPMSLSSISSDIFENGEERMTPDSVHSYISSLQDIFVLENSLSWNPNLRSKYATRVSDTLYFTDPSIGMAALGIGAEDLLKDLPTFGLFFETLAIRDLRVYTDYLSGDVYHYRDKGGTECDAVIHLRNGKYGLCEIKLGGDALIDSGAATLIKLSSMIDDTKMNAPSFLMVLVGIGNYAYKRKDGVFVVPIGCLGP